MKLNITTEISDNEIKATITTAFPSVEAFIAFRNSLNETTLPVSPPQEKEEKPKAKAKAKPKKKTTKGRKLTDEEKAQRREAMKKVWAKRKASGQPLGRPQTDEEKARRSESMKRTLAAKKAALAAKKAAKEEAEEKDPRELTDEQIERMRAAFKEGNDANDY